MSGSIGLKPSDWNSRLVAAAAGLVLSLVCAGVVANGWLSAFQCLHPCWDCILGNRPQLAQGSRGFATIWAACDSSSHWVGVTIEK